MRKFDRFILPIAYGLLAVVLLLSILAVAVGVLWPFYVAVVVYIVGLLAYVLPAAATLINRHVNIGGVVSSLILVLIITPVVLVAGGSLAVASSVSNSLEDMMNPGSDQVPMEPDMSPQDYSGASTGGECEDIWLNDYSGSADADYEACLERVGSLPSD